jgi:peroxiredoxin
VLAPLTLVVAAACAPRVVVPDAKAVRPSGKVEAGCHPKVGSKAPDVSLLAPDGRTRRRIEPGTVTFVYFWATWESPSKAAFPRFDETWRKLRARGYRILAISVDDEGERVAEAARSWGATFPFGWDQGHAVASCWGPESEPMGFLVDKKGVVRALHPGYHDGEAAVIEQEAEALLAEPPASPAYVEPEPRRIELVEGKEVSVGRGVTVQLKSVMEAHLAPSGNESRLTLDATLGMKRESVTLVRRTPGTLTFETVMGVEMAVDYVDAYHQPGTAAILLEGD